MGATHARGFWFHSSLFEVEPGEDAQTNPRVYEKQLAAWIKSRLGERGYASEGVIAEDWGWCVMCSRDPFMLWVGCGNISDPEEAVATPDRSRIVWHCFPVAEVPFWKRLFRKHDTAGAVAKLDSALEAILNGEPEIRLVSEP